MSNEIKRSNKDEEFQGCLEFWERMDKLIDHMNKMKKRHPDFYTGEAESSENSEDH